MTSKVIILLMNVDIQKVMDSMAQRTTGKIRPQSGTLFGDAVGSLVDLAFQVR